MEKPALLPYWKIGVSQHHTGGTTNQLLTQLNPKELIRVGGCGYKFICVMEGLISDYIQSEIGTSKWDTCASEALFKSLGGLVFDIRGRELTYRPEDKDQRNEGLIVTYDPEHVSRIVDEARSLLP